MEWRNKPDCWTDTPAEFPPCSTEYALLFSTKSYTPDAILMTYQVGIYIFNNVEMLDFAGPYEVFTCASRINHTLNPLFNVFTVAEMPTPIHARAGLKIEPDFTLTNHPPLDYLIIPGGVVSDELNKSQVIAWITQQSHQVKIISSVCTGAFLLAQAGILSGKSATTHWEDIAELRAQFPEVRVVEQVRWVDEGRIISSAGISAGIDMCLHLIERIHGSNLAQRTAKQLEFDWQGNR